MLEKDLKYGKLFRKGPKFIYRKGKSIANQLIKSDITPKKCYLLEMTNMKGTFPCNSCQHCSSVIKGPNIHHPVQGYSIPVKDYYTCSSENIIYLLKCPCGMAYVGQMSRNVKIRLNEHKFNIQLYGVCKQKEEQLGTIEDSKTKFGKITVAKHFFESKHQVSDLRWQIIECIHGIDRHNAGTVLLQHEAY